MDFTSSVFLSYITSKESFVLFNLEQVTTHSKQVLVVSFHTNHNDHFSRIHGSKFDILKY